MVPKSDISDPKSDTSDPMSDTSDPKSDMSDVCEAANMGNHAHMYRRMRTQMPKCTPTRSLHRPLG
jgi:hypothetical protein